MLQSEFEEILAFVCAQLTNDIRSSSNFSRPATFETHARELVAKRLSELGRPTVSEHLVQNFPDIVVGHFGIEIKATESDSWRCIANSVSEGHRVRDVNKIYVIFGKLGGSPEVRWADYGNSIVHVRTSHVPRFEIEIGTQKPLFDKLGTSYEHFQTLPMELKMPYIRKYARDRLNPGERLWWLEDKEVDDQLHSLPLNVKIYMDLPRAEKRQLRAEAAILCPIIVSSPHAKNGKYSDAVSYLMTYHGVLCPQARDLFSAGSVAGKKRGGNYVERALIDIQPEMILAADRLEDRLFEEFWGYVPPKSERIQLWLKDADAFATTWKPSKSLFLEGQIAQKNNLRNK